MAKAAAVQKAAEQKPIPPKGFLVPSILKTAVSKDIGPKVVAGFAKTQQDEAAYKQLGAAIQTNNKANMAMLTAAIVKAAINDPKNFDLGISFSNDKGDKERLNDNICLAVGIKEIVQVGDGPKAPKTVQWAKSVGNFFPMPGEDRNAPEIRKKETFRSNFSHTMTTAVKAACTIVSEKMKVSQDANTGVLMISGPAVQRQFGAKTVALDGRKVVGEGDEKVTLKDTPSYAAVVAMSQEKHTGTPTVRASGTRTSTVSGDNAIIQMAKQMAASVQKLETISDKVREALYAMVEAVEAKTG